MASSTRVLDVLTSEIEISQGDVKPDKDKIVKSNIKFQNVDFAYTNRDNTFTKLSLEILAGKTTGIVGSTGAGKTTLTRLLLRFAQPNGGSIVWGGAPIDEWSLSHLRSSIALVEQHITLFPTTILENIRYGDATASDEQVFRAADTAEVSEFVNSLPDGWSTMVGEGGYRLSGGQRQRLAIARAVLKDAPLLILDEATSAVDNETEAALQRSIELVSKNRTTVIIAHRLSTIRNADTILVMDNGQIAESGTHDELIVNGGIYHGLWAVQTGKRL
jgi:ATP-binding cassette subfamily B protein